MFGCKRPDCRNGSHGGICRANSRARDCGGILRDSLDTGTSFGYAGILRNSPKITLATGADYARDPEAYDPQESWERALKEQYGSLSRDMELFAGQSQHMENSWAKAGRQDGAELRASMDALWKSWPDGESSDADWEKVYGQVEELHAASGNLLHSLPMHVLEECRPQLMQMQRIAEADRTALELMKSVRAGDERKSGRLISVLEKKRGEIVRKERKAMISEKTARAFLDEVLAYAADRKREST